MTALARFIQFRKVDEAKRLVYGVAAAEVPDRADEIMDYESAKPQFAKWSGEMAKDTGGDSVGNLRAMHGKVAAGKVTNLDFNDDAKAIEVVAKVVDDDEWKKVVEKVYTGFSMGGRYVKRWTDQRDPAGVTRYTPEPQEISLVDRPCIPTATFEFVKADGSVETRHFDKRAGDPVNHTEPKTGTVPTNSDIAARARKLASEAGSADDWPKYLDRAKSELLAEEEPTKKVGGEPNTTEVKEGVGDRQNKAAGSPVDGEEWEQVWLCKRDGTTHKRKEDLRAHLAKLEADEAAKAAAGPASDILARLDALGDKFGDPWWKRDYSDEERKAMQHTGEAMDGGRYPIKSGKDVENAVKDWSRTGQALDVKKHILRRATELGALDKVPDDWRGDTSAGGDTKSKAAGGALAKEATGLSVDHAAVHASMARFHAQHATGGGDGADLHKGAAAAHADAFMAHATGQNDAAAKSDAAFGQTCKCWGMGKAAQVILRKAADTGARVAVGPVLAKWAGQEVWDASNAMSALSTIFGVLGSEMAEMESEPPEQIAALKTAIEALKVFIASEIREDSSEKAAGGDLEKVGARNSKSDMGRIQQAHDAIVELGAICGGKGAVDAQGKMRGKHVHSEDLEKVEAERDDARAKIDAMQKAHAEQMDAIAARLKALEDMPMPLPIASLGARSVQKVDDNANAELEAQRNAGVSLDKMMQTPEGREAIANELIKAAQRNPRILGVQSRG